MGLEKYRITPTLLNRYYDVFLQNSVHSRRFRITLISGDSVSGVPTAGSLASPTDPHVSFYLRLDDGGAYRIPFSELKEAMPLS
jgi:hypothetical protein